MTSFPSSIPLTSSFWSITSRFDLATGQNATDTSTKHYDAMYNGNAQYDHGIQFRKSGTSTYIDVEGTGDSGVPHSVSIGSSYSSAISVDITNAVGSVVSFWDNSSNRWYYFTVTSNMLFVSATGPTVTSITVNESTQFVTVLHTGTLTSSDINYNISNVSSSITNLQTTTNGSTFTASGSNGAHVIQIGGEIATYYIYNATSGRTAFSNNNNNNNLVVSFPTTDNAWLSNFSAYDSGTITSVSYYDTKTSVIFRKDASRNYYVFVTFNLNYYSSQGGYSVLTQIYDYTNSVAPNWNYSYSSTLQWVYPEATFESTGSADTLITLPTNEIVASVNWNFASVVASDTTTSNGGGKPDRYPLIMTNLFNRNRSIYSIGMTHKDTWDLFL